jgi:hypothetical protein
MSRVVGGVTNLLIFGFILLLLFHALFVSSFQVYFDVIIPIVPCVLVLFDSMMY